MSTSKHTASGSELNENKSEDEEVNTQISSDISLIAYILYLP